MNSRNLTFAYYLIRAHPGVDLAGYEFLGLSPGERLLLRAVLADVAEAVREEGRLLGVDDDHVEDGAPVGSNLAEKLHVI